MLPKWHFLSGMILALILFFITSKPLAAAIVFFSSFLIDFDHYLYRIFQNKSLNLAKIYKFCVKHRTKWIQLSSEKRKKYKRPIHYFHGSEFVVLILIISLFFKTFSFIFLGILFHLLIDYVELYSHKEPFYSKFSQIYVYLTNKNKKEFF